MIFLYVKRRRRSALRCLGAVGTKPRPAGRPFGCGSAATALAAPTTVQTENQSLAEALPDPGPRSSCRAWGQGLPQDPWGPSYVIRPIHLTSGQRPKPRTGWQDKGHHVLQSRTPVTARLQVETPATSFPDSENPSPSCCPRVPLVSKRSCPLES